ncbi:MAG: hypothetical protein ACJ76I_09105 [Gaiellaceae bacterium]
MTEEVIRPASEQTWLSSRLVIRAFVVGGLLCVAAAWRLDHAVHTAWDTQWVAPRYVKKIQNGACHDCLRLPSDSWAWLYAGLGLVGLILLLGAVASYRRRKYLETGRGLNWATWFLTGTATTGALAAGILRWLAGAGITNRLGYAALSEAAALAAIVLLATVLAAAVPDPGGSRPPLFRRILGFLWLQRAPLAAGVFLLLATLVIGQTSGQAIDSLRTWTVETRRGVARIGFGTAAALLLGLLIYETGLWRVQQELRPPTPRAPFRRWFWALLAVVLLAIGVVGPFGPGFYALPGTSAAIWLLDTRRIDQPAPGLLGRRRRLAAEAHTVEYAAVLPLVVLAVAAVYAAIDGGLAGHSRFAGLSPLLPMALFASGAILMTAERTRPRLRRPSRPWWLAAVAFVVAGGALAAFGKYGSRHWALAASGAFSVFAMLLLGWYVIWLFRFPHSRRALHGTRTVPLAVGAGLALFVAVHLDDFGAAPTLGTFAIVLLAFAAVLSLGFVLSRLAARYQAPRLLRWIGVEQFPLFALFVVTWVAAGAFAPTTLHEAQLVRRTGTTPAPTLRAAFAAWTKAQPELARGTPHSTRPVPMLLVAAHGGGIKAAYWTDVALDCIVGVSPAHLDLGSLESPNQDVAAPARAATCKDARRDPGTEGGAARRIFLASGVSGGAVGLYVYARQQLDQESLDDGWVDSRLNHDFASPTLAWALFHDLPNHLFGMHLDAAGRCHRVVGNECLGADRAGVLADAFDRWFDERDVPPFPPLLRLTWDERSSADPADAARAQLVPLIVANAAVTGGNARAVISAANLGRWPDIENSQAGAEVVDSYPLAGTAEAVDALCADEDLALSTAVLLAARFPYVTPSGTIEGGCRGTAQPEPANPALEGCKQLPSSRCRIDVVDGGYQENSGLFTIDTIWPALSQIVAKYNRTSPRPIAPVIVEIDNHYRASQPSPIPGAGVGIQSLIPPLTAFGSHGAIETYARTLAYHLRPQGCTVTISPGLHPGLTAPLGWELSKGAREDLKHALYEPHPVTLDTHETPNRFDAALQLRTLQRWLGPDAEGGPIDLKGLEKCAVAPA